MSEATHMSVNRGIGKHVIYVTCNSALKTKDILTHAATPMNIEDIVK